MPAQDTGGIVHFTVDDDPAVITHGVFFNLLTGKLFFWNGC
jgi:hypothetical protein